MISVVIPTYNRRESLLDLLADIYRQRYIDFEVIVVDDHSTEDLAAIIQKKYPQTIVIRNEINRGVAVSRNRGIRRAQGEIVIGFDSDVRISDDRLFQTVYNLFHETSDVDGFAFRLITSDGKDDAPRWWHPLPVRTAAGRVFETNYFSGTAFAFRKEKILRVGLFPEIFWQFYEENELAYKLIDSGGKILYNPKLCVTHAPGSRPGRNRIRFYYHVRNQILFSVDCFPTFRALTFVCPRLGYGFLKAVFSGETRTYFRAIHSAVKELPERIRSRKPLKSVTWSRFGAMRQNPR